MFFVKEVPFSLLIVQDYCDILTNDLLQPALDISWLNELKEIIVDITMPALSLEITNYREQISEGEAPSNDGTLQVFTSAIEAAMPFAPCEEQQQYTAVLSEAKNATHRKITLNDLLAFLGLLISLYSAIIASLPNEQLDKIISNQEAIITQQAEQESQEHSDLVDAIEILQDGICSLANEVNALREQIEELNNSVDPESDGTDSNIQEDD